MNAIRRSEIKKIIEKKDVVSLKELSEIFPNVSLMTLHRDLGALEEEGVIVRIRGGAKYAGPPSHEPSYDLRAIKNRFSKEIIAEKAITLIEPGSSLFFDSGTTIMELARLMPDLRLSVFTTGPNIALELAKKQNILVNICGGTVSGSHMTITGSFASDMLSKVNIDIAFLVASGYSIEGGFTCGSENVSQIKKDVIKKARTVVLMIDSTKFDKMRPFTFADMSNVDYVICDTDLPENLRSEAEKYNVKIL